MLPEKKAINEGVQKNAKIISARHMTGEDKKQTTKGVSMDIEKNDSSKVFNRAHYFDKLQNVIQSLGFALDAQLDFYEVNDDEKPFSDNEKLKMALTTLKDKVDNISKNDRVIAAKEAVLSTASTLGKKVAKETMTYVQTLDYNDLVEKGYVSETIIFPDTRAMHCQMPIFKRMNKRCVKNNEKQILPKPTDWVASFRNKVFATDKVTSPPDKGGWSVPMWRACDKGSCHDK